LKQDIREEFAVIPVEMTASNEKYEFHGKKIDTQKDGSHVGDTLF
jgi:hypothetical protein